MRRHKVSRWYWNVEIRRLLFQANAMPKINDLKPKGCVWNRYRIGR